MSIRMNFELCTQKPGVMQFKHTKSLSEDATSKTISEWIRIEGEMSMLKKIIQERDQFDVTQIKKKQIKLNFTLNVA